ncbi:unnamed protein product [Calypogeia fissa]
MGCAHGKSIHTRSPTVMAEEYHPPSSDKKAAGSPMVEKESRKVASPMIPHISLGRTMNEKGGAEVDDTYRPSPLSRPVSGLLVSGPQAPFSPDLDLADLPRFSKVSSTFMPTSGSKVVSVPSEKYELRYSFLTQRGYYPEALDKANQDSFCVHTPFGNDPNDHFFGVFDGHGEFGTHCSQFARKQLCDNLLRNRHFKTNALKAYHQAFIGTNLQLHRHHIDDSMSGTTGITVLVRGRTLYVANVGDSRAVLAERRGKKIHAVDLSNDQTPFRPDECARVRLCGARVLSLDQLEGLKNPDVQCWGGEEDDDGDPPRLWVQNGMYPGTAFTRSLGDTVAEQIGVIAVPEVLIVELTIRHPFFVIASDGVFEFLSSQAVVDMVAKHKDPQEACAAIVAESYRLWLQNETRTDDITVIVVFIDSLEEDAFSLDRVDEDSGTENVEEGEGPRKRFPSRGGLLDVRDRKPVDILALQTPNLASVKGLPVDTLLLGEPLNGVDELISPMHSIAVDKVDPSHLLLAGKEDLRGSRKQFFHDLSSSPPREAESGDLSPLCLNSESTEDSNKREFASRADPPSSEPQSNGEKQGAAS